VTVSSTSSHVVHPGNGATTSFPSSPEIKAASDLAYTDEAGGDFVASLSQSAGTGFGQACGRQVIEPLSRNPIAAGTNLQ
jgi:hypothetical protein